MKIFSFIIHFIKNDLDPESQIKWSLYLRVWKEFGLPYWPWLSLGVICTILASSAEGFAITLVQKMIDQGFIEKNMESLYFIGVELIGAYLLKSVFSYTQTTAIAKAGLLAAANLRKRLYRHLVSLPVAYFEKQSTGIMMNAFTNLAGAMLGMVTVSAMSLIQNISTLIIMITLMFWYAPQITFTLFFLGPTIAVCVTILARKRRAIARRSFSVEGKSLSLISETIIGIKTIQAFGTEQHEYGRISDNEDSKVSIGMKAARIVALQSPVLEVLISFGLCAALITGGHFITSGSLTTGDFTAFLLALTAAYKPAKSLTSISGGIQVGLIAAEGLFDMLDRQSDIRDRPDAVRLNKGPMHVEARQLTFSYVKDEPVLRGIDFDVPPGSVCAFVGQSGGGKSTIFNMLLRFYDPTGGGIFVNGRDLRELTLNSLRRSIAYVSQDVFLFDASVADNIRYGNDDATTEDVIRAAKAANAHDFIMAFPLGYDNPVGERGMMLSGGQKQRIAIARAILRDAPILLLDEATSALDSNAENTIQTALKRLMRGRTTFVIAHRLSTILDTDQICVVRQGRIVERGTDAELTALNGEYKKLKDLQFKKRKMPSSRADHQAAPADGGKAPPGGAAAAGAAPAGTGIAAIPPHERETAPRSQVS